MTETVAIDATRGPLPAPPSLSFIGAGRAGSALARALRGAGYPVNAVASRSGDHARRLAADVGAEIVPTAVAAARAADLCFVTVPDPAITPLAATVAATGMALGGRGLVHCSGALDRHALAAARHSAAAVAALHPLVALVPGSGAEAFRGVFFALDADPSLDPVLRAVVRDLGGTVFSAPAGDRALYHAAAVLAGNAPVALLARAVELLEASGVPRGTAEPALAALLGSAARNAARLGPSAALTGPVARDDAATVRRHLQALGAGSPLAGLYLRLAADTLEVAGAAARPRVAAALAAAEAAVSVPAGGAAS